MFSPERAAAGWWWAPRSWRCSGRGSTKGHCHDRCRRWECWCWRSIFWPLAELRIQPSPARFWMLLALAVNESESEPLAEPSRDAKPRPGIPWLAAAGLAVAGAAVAGCYFSAYGPVLRCHAAMAKADDEPPHHTDAKRDALLEATAADSFSAEPWQALAELELPQVQNNPTAAASRSLFVAASSRMLELRPHASSAWRQVGHWYWLLFDAASRSARQHNGRGVLSPGGRAVSASGSFARRIRRGLYMPTATSPRRQKRPARRSNWTRSRPTSTKNCRRNFAGNSSRSSASCVDAVGRSTLQLIDRLARQGNLSTRRIPF